MIVLGVDPGLHGALAAVKSSDMSLLRVLAIPSIKARKRGREVAWADLVDMFDFMLPAIDHAFAEHVGAMPHQGVSSMFKFGFVAGGLRGILAARRTPITYVSPTAWKSALGLSSSKDASRARAMELFPKSGGTFAKVKDEGVAEAALIAYYGAMALRGKKL